MTPSTAEANHLLEANYGGSDSAGIPVELNTLLNEPSEPNPGEWVRLLGEYYCGAGIFTSYLPILEFPADGTHYFSGGNQAGTFFMEGEFPTPGTVTGRIVLDDCGIDRTFQATAGAEPPPLPSCDVAPPPCRVTSPPPSAGSPVTFQPVEPPTGQRAAALKKCKKKKTSSARKKCKKKANLLPV
ncbi:MAG: hypothetical protein ACXWW8_01775 [Solirubrobacterales bacterium]